MSDSLGYGTLAAMGVAYMTDPSVDMAVDVSKVSGTGCRMSAGYLTGGHAVSVPRECYFETSDGAASSSLMFNFDMLEKVENCCWETVSAEVGKKETSVWAVFVVGPVEENCVCTWDETEDSIE